MLWIVHDHDGGQQRAVLDRAAAVIPPLWIGVDHDPPDVACYAWWKDQPFEGMAAAAARLYHRNLTKEELVISTMAGYLGQSMRSPRASDHSPQTKALARVVCEGGALPGQIIIAGLSLMYERALAVVGGTITWSTLPREGAVELVPAFAGNAITHLCLDLARSGIPVLASATTITQGKRHVPFLPRNMGGIADRILTPNEFDLAEWREICQGHQA